MAAVSDEKRQANTEINRVRILQVSTNDSAGPLDPSVASSTRTVSWHTIFNWMYYQPALTMADNYAFLIVGVLCSAVGGTEMIMSCLKSQETRSLSLPGLKVRRPGHLTFKQIFSLF